MSFFTDDTTPPQTPVDLVTQPYRGITNDTRLIPTTDLLTHVKGSKWVVTYYSQVLGVDSEPTAYSPSIPPALQQYVRIREFEFKVTTPIEPQSLTENAEFKVEGTAFVFPHVVPNVGDMFIAPVRPGQLGFFTLTSAEPKSIFQQPAYEIRYELRSLLDDTTSRDLEKKVTKDVIYVRDFLRVGRNPMLVESEYAQYQTLLTLQQTLINQYFEQNYVHEFEAFLVPDQDTTTYDPYVVDFISHLVPKDRYRFYQKAEQLVCDDVNSATVTTLFDVLLKGDTKQLVRCRRDFALLPTKTVFQPPLYRTIRYSGIDLVVKSAQDHPNATRPINWIGTPPTIQSFSAQISTTELSGLLHTQSSVSVPLWPLEPAYVVSEAFYRDYVATCVLEQELKAVLDNQTPQLARVLTLARDLDNLSEVQRFYFTPLVLFLSVYALGAIN